MARTANFTITEDFRKVLKDLTKRVIIFRAHIFSDRQQRDDNFFVFCDYIDEDTIIADISNSMIGDYQANWVTLQYLAIDNDNYRQFLSETRSVNSLISKSGWKDAFDSIRMEGDTGDLDIESYASNYLVLDFSKYEVNCSIQLMNTFDRGDLEFIHSHYHSKNLSDKDILTSVGEKLAYYDDLEYSKLEQNENETLRDKTKIEQDRFNPGKPEELKLKNKVNYVRMFRPEEYYHMGDFTVKLLGKPLSKTKYNYPSNEVNNDDKMDREDLKVLGVTNPESTNQDRDLQYVDMFEYNRYLQPVFRQWDKNINPNKITKTNPYLYTIKDVTGTLGYTAKGFLTYFKVLTSSELIEVVIRCTPYTPGMPDFNLADNLIATIKLTGGIVATDISKYQLSYKQVGSSLQLYFKLDESLYGSDKSLTLLEAGIQTYSGTKDELTIMDENIPGISGTTNFKDENVKVIQSSLNNLTLTGSTENVSDDDERDLWNGNLLNSTYNASSVTFISKDPTKPQYAKLVFTDFDNYGNRSNPFPSSSGKVETSVTLIGGYLNNGDTDKVAFGVPFLCVKKGFKSRGEAIINNLTTEGNVKFNDSSKTFTVAGKTTFNNDVTISNKALILTGSSSSLTYKGGATNKFVYFENGDSNGDATIFCGTHGTTVLASGEAASDWSKLATAASQNNYHTAISNLGATNEELVLMSDQGITFFAKCQYGQSAYARFSSSAGDTTSNTGNVTFKLDSDRSSKDVSFNAKNFNGEVSLLTSTNRGLYDNTYGKWIIAYIKSNSSYSGVANESTMLEDGPVYIMHRLFCKDSINVTGSVTNTFNQDIQVSGPATGNYNRKVIVTGRNGNYTSIQARSVTGDVYTGLYCKSPSVNSEVAVLYIKGSELTSTTDMSKKNLYTDFNVIPGVDGKPSLGTYSKKFAWVYSYSGNIENFTTKRLNIFGANDATSIKIFKDNNDSGGSTGRTINNASWRVVIVRDKSDLNFRNCTQPNYSAGDVIYILNQSNYNCNVYIRTSEYEISNGSSVQHVDEKSYEMPSGTFSMLIAGEVIDGKWTFSWLEEDS